MSTIERTPRSAIEEASGSGANGITWTSFRFGPDGFCRAQVLLTGKTEAVLIDGGFTLADGQAIAEEITATGKILTSVLVTAEDPDFYFGLGPIVAAHPEAKIIAPVRIARKITATAQHKLNIWAPQMVGHTPTVLSELVLPEPFDDDYITVDGERIEIVTASKIGNRKYLWVPAVQGVFGGVLVHSGVHVWTADTQQVISRKGWVEELNMILDRNPDVVVAGHAAQGAPTDQAGVIFNRDYLVAFDEELERTSGSAELATAMLRHYPDAGMQIALDIGSKVNTGEMDWD